MNEHRRILNFISLIRSSHSEMTSIFLYGSCLNFYMILKAVFPSAKPWISEGHVITEINGKFYDITGRVSSKGFMPIHQYYDDKRLSRQTRHMLKSEYDLKK